MATMSEGGKRTLRYERKRESILHAAAEVINETGVSGLTFVEVAQRVGLNTPSITYYFKKKDDLAAAALDLALDGIEEQVRTAAAESTVEARVSRFLELGLDRAAGIRNRQQRRRAQLGELRAISEPMRSTLGRRYAEIFRMTRGFFGEDTDAQVKAANIVRALLLTENVYWMPIWLRFYSEGDFARVHARMMEVFGGGLLPDGGAWQPRELDWSGGAPEGESNRDAFLRAATLVINERGYRGASVDRIASQLEVTKGSFYHHNETKDELVLQCFERSYRRISDVQRAVLEQDWPSGDKLATAVRRLLDTQLRGEQPFLRTASLQFLPPGIRERALERSGRNTRRFASLLVDGIADGSVAAIDPLIGSQMVVVAVNSARDLHHWSSPGFGPDAAGIYEDLLANGLF